MSGGDDVPERVIRIELHLDGETPEGVATGPGGVARDFTGWMGLMSAVDALADDQDHEGGRPCGS